ncbi:YczE/YyaS/YitT family protein [Thalassobacillus hwangdonensis]|uniref:YitT family protein n=1 Tax=Thalassobacillus hwangdonensis TaxID=546108 RepID=A0ABW3KXM1_9BACI
MKYLFLFYIYIIGLVVSSLGLALIIRSGLGVGPGDSVAVGLSLHLPVTVGTVMIISFLILLGVNAWLERSRPRIESIIPILIRGGTVDFFLYVFLKDASYELWWSQWLVFTLGLLALGAGIAIYLRTPFPRIPLDHFMMIMNDKTKQSKSFIRILAESTLALIGFLLGAPVGIGTLIVALLLGPMIQYFYTLCRPIVKLWSFHQKEKADG